MDIPRICGVLPYDKVLYFVLAYLSILFVVLVLWFNRATTAPSLVKTGMSATVPDLFAAVRDRAIFSLAVSVLPALRGRQEDDTKARINSYWQQFKRSEKVNGSRKHSTCVENSVN